VKDIRTLVAPDGGRVDWGGPSGQIAFSKLGPNKAGEVYLMNPDGSSQQCLTCGKPTLAPGSSDQPAWHPSGQYIVFQSVDPSLKLPGPLASLADQLTQGGAGLNNNLWAMTPDGSQFWQLTHVPAGGASLHPHFNAAGTKILWSSRLVEGSRLGQGSWALTLADWVVDGSGPRLANLQNFQPNLARGTFYESHGFSPDGSKIVFSASIGRPSMYDLDIWTMDLASGQLTNLTNSPGVWDEHAHYSPSGNKIVWISSRGYAFTPSARWAATLKTDYWLMNADGSNPVRLTYFNEPGYPEYVGGRTIVADCDWNLDGTAIVATVAVIAPGLTGSRVVILDLNGPQ
jgi:Tol biopolymer transport system component